LEFLPLTGGNCQHQSPLAVASRVGVNRLGTILTAPNPTPSLSRKEGDLSFRSIASLAKLKSLCSFFKI
jgi:hypothetical protein